MLRASMKRSPSFAHAGSGSSPSPSSCLPSVAGSLSLPTRSAIWSSWLKCCPERSTPCRSLRALLLVSEVMYVARAIGFAKFDRECCRARPERRLRFDPDPPQHACRTRFGLPAGSEFLRRNLIRDLQGKDARRSVSARWAGIRLAWRVGALPVHPHAAEL